MSCRSCGYPGIEYCIPCRRWDAGVRETTVDGAYLLGAAIIDAARRDFSIGMAAARHKRPVRQCEAGKHRALTCAVPILKRAATARRTYLNGAFVDTDLPYVAAGILAA